MTYSEHNRRIAELVNELLMELRKEHDKYTSSSKIMDSAAWESYVMAMDNISRKWKGTRLQDVAQYLEQYFLDDTEYIQKRLRKINDKL